MFYDSCNMYTRTCMCMKNMGFIWLCISHIFLFALNDYIRTMNMNECSGYKNAYSIAVIKYND